MVSVAVLAAAGSATVRIVVWAGGLIVVIVLAGVVLGRYRKWMRTDVEARSAQSWTLQDLRDLRRQGRISEQEFDTLKAAIIAEHQPKADISDAGPNSEDRPPD